MGKEFQSIKLMPTIKKIHSYRRDDTFELGYGRYGSGDGKTWHWRDN